MKVISAYNLDCLLIQCSYSFQGTIVELSTPNITIIPYLGINNKNDILFYYYLDF